MTTPTPPALPISCSPPSWLSYGNGKGPTYTGNAYRVMNTFRNTVADRILGPVRGVPVHEIATRTSLMNSKQLVDILELIQSKNPGINFSGYLATQPIQSIDVDFLKSHLTSLAEQVADAKNAIWILPLHLKTYYWVAESDHMTVLLVKNGQIEYYDPLGKAMIEQQWNKDSTLEEVAKIVHDKLSLEQPFQLTENFKLQQFDTVLCGFLVSAWLYRRLVLNENQTEWKAWLNENDAKAVRLFVANLLPDPKAAKAPADVDKLGQNASNDDFDIDIA